MGEDWYSSQWSLRFLSRFRFRLFGEKKLVNQCSSVDTIGDNKLSMKCFEINIFFGREGVLFSPLIRFETRLFVFQLLSLRMNENVCVFFPPFYFSRLFARCKNFEELRYARNSNVMLIINCHCSSKNSFAYLLVILLAD